MSEMRVPGDHLPNLSLVRRFFATPRRGLEVETEDALSEESASDCKVDLGIW